MRCPKCETDTLAATVVRGIEVDRCSRCHGIWFDAKELTRLLTEESHHLKLLKGRETDPGRNTKPGKCPRDGADLIRAASSRRQSVILDTCPVCRGLWLDGGELESLIERSELGA